MPSENSLVDKPDYVALLEQMSADQLGELIRAIGATCAGADYGAAKNTDLATALLKAGIVIFESNRCSVEMTIDCPFWEEPAYYKSGEGACVGIEDGSEPAEQPDDTDPDNF